MASTYNFRNIVIILKRNEKQSKRSQMYGTYTLRKKCPYSELIWSLFPRIRNEYGEILRTSPYSVQMRENTDQNNSEYKHFSRNDKSPLLSK